MDPVVAGFLTGNAEVRYELGVHTDRKLRCHLHHRAPEPDTLAEDNKALAAKASTTRVFATRIGYSAPSRMITARVSK